MSKMVAEDRSTKKVHIVDFILKLMNADSRDEEVEVLNGYGYEMISHVLKDMSLGGKGHDIAFSQLVRNEKVLVNSVLRLEGGESRSFVGEVLDYFTDRMYDNIFYMEDLIEKEDLR